MTRDEFRLISLGQFIMTHQDQSLDYKVMTEFADGAIFAWDWMEKKNRKLKEQTRAVDETPTNVEVTNDLPTNS